MPSSREARLTLSPITVHARRLSEPMLPDIDRAGVQADADGDLRAPFRSAILRFSFSSLRIISRGAATSAIGMILLRIGRSPERHDGVADVFVERAQIAENNVRHCAQVFIEQRRVRPGVRPSESVVKSRMSLNITVSSLVSPPGRMYFCGSFSISAITPGERYCENVLRIFRFSRSSRITRKLVMDGIIGHQRARGNHEAEPAPPVRKTEVDEPGE